MTFFASKTLVVAAAFLLFTVAPSAAQGSLEALAEGSLSERSVQIFIILTILSLVPAIAIMFTCFPFMVTVLAILRQGLGLQQSPPNMLIITLALFLTYFVMEPVFLTSWETGIQPLSSGELSISEALPLIIDPFQEFMIGRVNSDTMHILSNLRPEVEIREISESPLSILVPSFLLSEIERAFQIGFLVFLPFLIIDLVVAAILMSMGMMMVPPVIVSLPFKLAFFVVADGWSLVSGALVRSYF